ncbi:MAG: NrfD/PsrC family molybdoenzyme membrane anchor subunit [Gammaproteobacteria bacterium]
MNENRTAAAIQGATSSRRPGPALRVLIVLFVVGVASLVYGWTDESTQPDIGLLIVSYLFLMGVSQVGVVFCAITRLVHAQWAKPYYRLAELSTLAFTPFAFVGFLLIFVYAQDDLFYWLSPAPEEHLSAWLNIDWLLIRNLAGLAVFYGLSTYYALKALKPDLADAKMQEADHREVAGQLYMLSPLVIAAFIACNTFIAWDFGMMLIPHWHSTVFPILFWFGNLFAGTAALIVFPALLGRTSTPDSHFGPDQVRSLGMMVTGFTLMWLYFFWAQFFVMWFGNLPHETDPLWRQMYGHYGPYFWTMMAGCFFVPFAALIFAFVKRSVVAMCLIAFGINLGIWLFKYLMVVPVLRPDDQPFSSWLDVSVAIGLAAGFAAAVVFLASRVPMYSRWEMALKPIPRR